MPVTVLFVAGFSALFTAFGVRPFVLAGRGDDLVLLAVNFLQSHVLNLFMHAGTGHYVGNMVPFLLFGVALTWLTTNAHVTALVLVTHVLGSLLVELTVGVHGIGTSLAVAGLIAATVVHTAALLLGKTASGLVRRVLGAAFALTVLLGFLWIAGVGTVLLQLSDFHVWGWLVGGVAETVWVLQGGRGR